MHMMFKVLAATALTMIALQPAIADPKPTNPAARLSIAKPVRSNTKTAHNSNLSPAVIIGVLATAAIIGGAIALADNDDDPDSP